MSCEVCQEAVPKYTCPRCSVRTCSLGCVKRHKADQFCDGVRDKTKYVPMKDFSDLNLLSDYRLLEDCGRRVDSARRDPMKWQRHKTKLRKWLVSYARKRGIQLQILPQNFSRRKQNTTCFNQKSKTLHWHIEWSFDSIDVKTKSTKVAETRTLSEVYGSLFDPTQSDPIMIHRLKKFADEPVENLKFLLKREKCSSESDRFYELDPAKTISSNLENKTLVEFPTIHVIQRSQNLNCDAVGKPKSKEEESEDSSSEDSEDSSTDSSSSSDEDAADEDGDIEEKQSMETESSETADNMGQVASESHNSTEKTELNIKTKPSDSTEHDCQSDTGENCEILSVKQEDANEEKCAVKTKPVESFTEKSENTVDNDTEMLIVKNENTDEEDPKMETEANETNSEYCHLPSGVKEKTLG